MKEMGADERKGREGGEPTGLGFSPRIDQIFPIATPKLYLKG